MAAKAVPLDKQQALDDLLRFCTVKLAQEKHGWGSGFFVAPGYILTCAHVVKDLGDKSIKVFWQKTGNPYVPDGHAATNGEKVEFLETEAKVEGLFPDPYDIALLKLTSPIPNHPCVYLDESAQPESSVRTGDELYIFGYPDKDFSNGAPVAASCENLTGDNPRQIKFKSGQIRPGLSGSPLLNHRTRKVCGIVKYTRDKSSDLGGGAIPSAAIFSKFNDLKVNQKAFHRKDSRWRNLLPSARCSLQRVIFTSLGVAILVLLIRIVGGLQPLELKIFDNLMSLRPKQQDRDKRLLVIEIDDEDVQIQRDSKQETKYSQNTNYAITLNHKKLSELLERFKANPPLVIGLDLQRPEIPSELKDKLAETGNLFAICIMPTSTEQKSGEVTAERGTEIKAPPGVPHERIAFANFIDENDEKVVRRHLLAQKPPVGTKDCIVEESFSLALSRYYLEKHEKIDSEPPQFTQEGECKIEFKHNATTKTFGQFDPFTGGYQNEKNYGGCQILLNYSTLVIETVSLRKFLENKKYDVKNKIVLIGTSATDGEDIDHITPYGKLPGVMIQAHMISHILDVVLNKRSLILVMPKWAEISLIILCSFLGGFFAWQIQSFKNLVIALLVFLFLFYLFCLVTLWLLSGWLPFVPMTLTFIASGIGVAFSGFSLTFGDYRKPLGSAL